jgi:hypothetical protein
LSARADGAQPDKRVDDGSCWILGQSIKDAAKSEPPYLAHLPADDARLKVVEYGRNAGGA